MASAHTTGAASSPTGDGVVPVRPGTFALFSETLLTGLVVALLCLPVVTVLPAVAAGVAHLRRHVEGRADPVRSLLADFATFLRGSWLLGIATPVVLFLLVLNIDIATATGLPGRGAVRIVSVVLAAGLLVLALRTAGGRALRPEHTWTAALREAARRSVADPAGSVLVLVAVGLCAVLIWMLNVLVVIVPGLLVLAVLSVEHRHQRRRIA